ncbi:hypothetical protein HMPREF1549_02923 [Actinomyces johnsonii F0510]|uniref:Uncharacterized protein n=1 Tax=Actinomyces johnsonii F0510 TaxID=1227262 RepID=U1R823_9ACTO|nr:hypothetical protein HMPREF1549_02923 [Actinomyces johnsonii F0510]
MIADSVRIGSRVLPVGDALSLPPEVIWPVQALVNRSRCRESGLDSRGGRASR